MADKTDAQYARINVFPSTNNAVDQALLRVMMESGNTKITKVDFMDQMINLALKNVGELVLHYAERTA